VIWRSGRAAVTVRQRDRTDVIDDDFVPTGLITPIRTIAATADMNVFGLATFLVGRRGAEVSLSITVVDMLC
jgi:hypothetical protein